MAKKIFKYLIISVFGLVIAGTGALMFVDDELVMDVAGDAAKPIVTVKHTVLDTVSGILKFDTERKVPSVVMTLPPPPETVAPPPAFKATAEPQNEGTDKISDAPPTPPAVMTEKTSEPMTSGMSDAITSDTPEPMTPESSTDQADMISTLGVAETDAPPPAPSMLQQNDATESTEAASPTQEMKTNAEIEESKTQIAETMSADNQAPAPDAAPTIPVEQETLTEQENASASPADAPPAAPAPEEQRLGEQDYLAGLRHYNGDGVEKNFGTAAQFFLKAAELGHVGAQYNLGLMNYVGQTGGQDFSNAAKWFQKAAESGHIQAQYNLGFLYYEGKGVEQDLKTAFDWISRAADQGYGKAVKARDALKKAMPDVFGS